MGHVLIREGGVTAPAAALEVEDHTVAFHCLQVFDHHLEVFINLRGPSGPEEVQKRLHADRVHVVDCYPSALLRLLLHLPEEVVLGRA